MARIVLRGLVKRFGRTTAGAGVDLEIHDGEFVVLVGPSGRGKTTTLNMLSGLETPTSGEIVIGDRVVSRANATRAWCSRTWPCSRT